MGAIDTEGRYNVGMGTYAGLSITTGDTNTFLGYNTGYGGQLATASNSTAIGNGAFTTASNQMVFGNTSVTQTIINGDTVAQTITGAKLTAKRVDTSITANDMVGKLEFYAADTSTTTNFYCS